MGALRISGFRVLRLARHAALAAIALAAVPAAARFSPFLYVDGQVTPLRVQGNDIIDVDINDQGLIAGSYYTGPGHVSGYLYDNGNFSSFAVPTAVVTSVSDVSNVGAVVGSYSSGSGGSRGYVYAGGSFTTFAAPGATDTQVTSVNDAGSVGGYFTDPGGNAHGFIKTGSSYQVIDVPGALGTYLTGINASGQAAGYSVGYTGGANSSVVLKSFIYSGGTYDIIDNPLGIDGGSIAFAINDQGELSGDYIDLARHRRGFLYAGGVFTGLGNRADPETFGVDLNNADTVVGYSTYPYQAYVFSGGTYQFLTNPSGEGIRFDAINNFGAAVGLYGFSSNGGVPEPDAWLLLVLGFGTVGSALRRSRVLVPSSSPPPA